MTTTFEPISVQGRLLKAVHIEEIRMLLRDNPSIGRTRISVMICERWNWRDELGRIKDMACRTMLLKLQARGLIELPPALSKVGGARNRSVIVEHDCSPIDLCLAALMPVRLDDARASVHNARLFSHLLATYHYLGFRDVGRNMKYIAFDRHERPLACLLFGSAAWKTQPRDQFIGWDEPTRIRNLQQITNNTRFLILPWVRVPHLASFLLARAIERLRRDWLARYGAKLAMVETFVDRSRFRGTCYRAANWTCVGQTKGRSRQDRYSQMIVPVKDVYLYPLEKEFRKCLNNS